MELARRHGTDTLGCAERALGQRVGLPGRRRTVARPRFDRLVDGAVASGDEARIAHACYMRSLSQTSTGARRRGHGVRRAGGRGGGAVRQSHGAGASGLRHGHLADDDAAGSGPRRAAAQRGAVARRRQPLVRAVRPHRDALAAGVRRRTARRAVRASPTSSRPGIAPATGPTSGCRCATCFGICHLLRADELAVIDPRGARAGRRRRRLPVRARRRRQPGQRGRRARDRLGDERFPPPSSRAAPPRRRW